MTGKEFEKIIRELNVTKSDLARIFNVSRKTIWNWTRMREVPEVVKLAINALRSRTVDAS